MFPVTFAGAFSPSESLDSSLLELSAPALAFLAAGPLRASGSLGGIFRFLASGDLMKQNQLYYYLQITQITPPRGILFEHKLHFLHPLPPTTLKLNTTRTTLGKDATERTTTKGNVDFCCAKQMQQ